MALRVLRKELLMLLYPPKRNRILDEFGGQNHVVSLILKM
ncbi:MAG: hypothetical protein AOA65_0729 [Candidatus Bathyarchaeota archaeon BA1]|nr:MAG: hypothetical protein AOA65_0729 [Candidatus Bathyarchaeota archaeon BA1]